MILPEGYIEGVPRVSNIVSFYFPFKGTEGEKRYLEWLKNKGIKKKEYLNEAKNVGTFIHLQLEKYLLGEALDETNAFFKPHFKEIINGIEYLNKLIFLPGRIYTEQLILDKKLRYQGCIDLVRINENTKTVYLYDYKTWGIAKKRFGLPNYLKKNSDKLKKVALQMSLYAEYYRELGYKIGGMFALWVHEDKIEEYSLFSEHHRQKVNNIRLWESKELDNLLTNFKINKIEGVTIINNDNNMFEIEILEPTKQYGNVKIRCELSKIDNGKSIDENIDDMIFKAKDIAIKMR